LIAALEKIRQPFNINSVAQAGALAALDDKEHMARTRKNNTLGLRFFEKALPDLNLEYVPSAANFILVRVGDGQRVFVELQRLGVIVRPMGGYQLPEWVRISIGTPAENERCLAGLSECCHPRAAVTWSTLLNLRRNLYRSLCRSQVHGPNSRGCRLATLPTNLRRTLRRFEVSGVQCAPQVVVLSFCPNSVGRVPRAP